MRGPVQDPPPPEIRAPRLRIDAVGIGGEPACHHGFRDRCGLRAGGDARQVAQPGEAVDVIGEAAAPVALREIERLDRPALAAPRQHAREQRFTAADVADHRIVGHCDQLQRIAPFQPHAVERGPPGQFLEAFGQPFGERQALVAAQRDQPLAFLDPVGRGLGNRGGQPPLKPAMLAA